MISQNGNIHKQFNIWHVDDHQLLKEIYKSIIESINPECKLAKQASNGKEAIELLKKFFNTELKPDLVILGLDMGEYDGYWFLEKVKSECFDIRILVVSIQSDELTINRLNKYNIRGIITKLASINDVKKAILKITSGGMYFHESIKSLVDNIKNGNGLDLTLREMEFVKLSATTLSYLEIAGKMNISYSAVNWHRGKVFEKLNIHSRSELIEHARKNKWI